MGEIQLGEGDQSVELKIGEDQWIRGAVVVCLAREIQDECTDNIV